MPNVDSFLEEVARDLRQRLALLDDGGDRRAIEDGIALLTNPRFSGMDATLFERLLATLGAGRSPAGLPVLKPQILARELSQRWQTYAQGARLPALN